MNWSAMDFDWNQVRAFLATVEEGSLSAAARALGLTQPTLGRQVSGLEARLGVTLFERVGRGLQLTEAGRELAEHVREMGEAATRLSLAASGQATAVEGRVTITASEIYSAYLLPRILRTCRERYPKIEITVLASNSLADLRRRDADIAVRNTAPTDPDLIARRLGDDLGSFYARRDWLDARPPAQSPSDFSGAVFIGLSDLDQQLSYLNQMGFGLTLRNFEVVSGNHLVHWELARAGVGIGAVPLSVGDRDPEMARILPNLEPMSFPIWLVAPMELKTSRRVRAVWDCLAEGLSSEKQRPIPLDGAGGPA
ncbi:LysR family transcriptional regulator [Litorisediminicola beolgyonensis]|uniref:LysR family transcriptional regulator n=1 Tax=Litorisediminicola beolgyonensis TaxID=1173614 RepID=A0ABW3ZFD0_9RHOB